MIAASGVGQITGDLACHDAKPEIFMMGTTPDGKPGSLRLDPLIPGDIFASAEQYRCSFYLGSERLCCTYEDILNFTAAIQQLITTGQIDVSDDDVKHPHGVVKQRRVRSPQRLIAAHPVSD